MARECCLRPRIRSIKPELWQSRDFMALPMVGKIAFFCLISHADDEGRLRTDCDHAALAWLHLPSDEVKVAFDALAERQMIQIYEVEREPYVQIANWHEHQRVDHPTESKYPAPPKRKPRVTSRELPSISEFSAGIGSDRKGSEGIGSNGIAPEARALCDLLIELMAANGCKVPTAPPVAWLKSASLLLGRDNRDPGEAEAVLRWSQANEFWKGNIRSLPKFREKYDTLRLQMQRKPASRSDQALLAASEWREAAEALS